MSRVGNAIIKVPDSVQFTFADNVVKVKGPKGELTQVIHPAISFELKEGEITCSRASDAKEHKAQHGLSRALVNNMVLGVSEGFKIEQELVGVGYRAQATGQRLELSLGFSHSIILVIPDEVKVQTVSEKGKNPMVILESHDKQLVGQVASKIRSLRKPEPYKGKGIRYVGEQIRRKAGKSASTK